MNKVSGYIELTINGEVYPVKFGMGAWKIISGVTGKPITQMLIGLPDEEILALILFGGINHAYKAEYKNAKQLGNLHNAYDLTDEMTSEQMKQLAQAFLESKQLGQTMADYTETASELNEKKKKK